MAPMAGNASKKGNEPKPLAGGNPQVPKGGGDGPDQAYIAAMPEWKHDVGHHFQDASLDPVSPVESNNATTRHLHMFEEDQFDEDQFLSWVEPAACPVEAEPDSQEWSCWKVHFP